MRTSPTEGPAPRPAAPLDDDERAFRARFGRTVDWYRVAQSRALLGAFLPGFLLLPLGSFLVALALLPRVVPISLQGAVTLAGLLVTASGPLWTIVQLLRSIRSDLYVAIRVDGLCVRLDPAEGERVYPWEVIDTVCYEEREHALRVVLENTDSVLIKAAFSDLNLPELGRRIRDARRLSVWNRLEPRFQGAEAGE